MEPEPEPAALAPEPEGIESAFSDVDVEIIATGQTCRYGIVVAGPRVTFSAPAGSPQPESGLTLDGTTHDVSAFSEVADGGGGLFGQGLASPFFISATVRLTSSSLTRVRLIFGARRDDRDRLLALIRGEHGMQLVTEEELASPGAAAGDLESLMREQEAAAARVAVDVGGIQLHLDERAGSDEDEDEDDGGDGDEGFFDVSEAEPGESGQGQGRLTEPERADAGALLSRATVLELSEEERIHVAADCRAACARAFTAADSELARSTMEKVAAEIGLSDSEVAFFGDVELDDNSVVMRKVRSEVPPAHLEPPKRFNVIFVLVGALSSEGRYDARQRAFLRRLTETYALDWAKIRDAETMHLEQMVFRKTQEATAEKEAQAAGAWGRRLKVGGAAVLGGAAMVLTAGVAAPAVVGVFGLVGLGGVLSAVGGAGFVSVLFGAAVSPPSASPNRTTMRVQLTACALLACV